MQAQKKAMKPPHKKAPVRVSNPCYILSFRYLALRYGGKSNNTFPRVSEVHIVKAGGGRVLKNTYIFFAAT